MKKIEKSKFKWKIIIPIAVIVLLLLIFVGMYNGLVSSQENVDKEWGNVESTYQRRADLIPNLVETVKGYQFHEAELLTSITEARSAWTNAADPGAKMEAAGSIDSALSRLMVVVENYPDLKASQNFLDLQAELAGTENRINVARQRFNDAVRDYNVRTRKFPNNIVAGMFGFSQRTMFEAVSGSDKAPEVKF